MTIDPEAQAFLDFQSKNNSPNVIDHGVHKTRLANHENLFLAGPIGTSAEIQHRFITSSTADIPIRIYIPKNAEIHGAIVYFHGGGWALGHIDRYDSQLVDISAGTNSVIVSVNYQKSPEHKFPIPLEDCYAATKWLFENAENLNIDKTKVGVCGDSAGATLAAAVAIKARDEKLFKISYQVLMYPPTSLNFDSESYLRYATGFGLTREVMIWFWNSYLEEKDWTNPYAVVSMCNDLSNLPTSIVVVPEYDVLRDDTVNYAKKLEDAGNQVQMKFFSGQIHGFFAHAGINKTSFKLREYLIESIHSLIWR